MDAYYFPDDHVDGAHGGVPWEADGGVVGAFEFYGGGGDHGDGGGGSVYGDAEEVGGLFREGGFFESELSTMLISNFPFCHTK